MAHSRYNPFQQLVSYNAGWLSRQLGGSGQPNAAGWHHCRCPAHHGDSLSALALKNTPSGRLVLKCFHGCDEVDVQQSLDQLAVYGVTAIGFDPHDRQKASAAGLAETSKVSTQRAARIWRQSLQDDLIGIYLCTRGITLTPPNDLRLHPDLYHRCGARSTAMVALIRNAEGEPTAVHRTWLMADGSAKAPLDPDKMTFGPMSGCAVRLASVADTVLLAEGIETTLAAMQLTNLPGWSTLSTSGMKAVQLPASIRSVTIAADHDAPGLEAAMTLCRRLEAEGRSVTMIRPNREGADFNDVLMEQTQ